MVRALTETERLAPIFVIADDDKEAIDRLIMKLNIDWYYIAVWQKHLVVRYARKLATTAIFLADSFDYPNGGAPRLLQELIDKVGMPVVIMTEVWTPEVVAKWKRMGAADCIPHPTQCEARIEGLRGKMEEFVLGRTPNVYTGPQENSH
jgi:DNA-binding NtrC family response regulator